MPANVTARQNAKSKNKQFIAIKHVYVNSHCASWRLFIVVVGELGSAYVVEHEISRFSKKNSSTIWINRSGASRLVTCLASTFIYYPSLIKESAC